MEEEPTRRTDALAFRSPKYEGIAWDISLSLVFLTVVSACFMPWPVVQSLPMLAVGIAAAWTMDWAIARRQTYTLHVETRGVRIVYEKPLPWAKRERLYVWEEVKSVYPAGLAPRGKRPLVLSPKRKTRFSELAPYRAGLNVPEEIAGDERFLTALRACLPDDVVADDLERQLAQPSRADRHGRWWRVVFALTGCLSVAGLLALRIVPDPPVSLRKHSIALLAVAMMSCVILGMLRGLRSAKQHPVDRLVNAFLLPLPVAIAFGLLMPMPENELAGLVFAAIACSLLAASAIEDLFERHRPLGSILGAAALLGILAGVLGSTFLTSISARCLGGAFLLYGEPLLLYGSPATPWTRDSAHFACYRAKGDTILLDWRDREGAVVRTIELPFHTYVRCVAGDRAVVAFRDAFRLMLIGVNGDTQTVEFDDEPWVAPVRPVAADGRRLLYALGGKGMRIGVLDVATGASQMLPVPEGVADGEGVCWTDDGGVLAYSFPADQEEADAFPQTVWKWDALDRPPRKVFEGKGGRRYTWTLAPTGQHIFIERRRQMIVEDVCLVDLTGNEAAVRAIQGIAHWESFFPVWSDDGSCAYVGTQEGIFEIDAASARARKIVHSENAHPEAATGEMGGLFYTTSGFFQVSDCLYWRSSTKTHRIVRIRPVQSTIACVHPSPDGKLVVFQGTWVDGADAERQLASFQVFLARLTGD